MRQHHLISTLTLLTLLLACSRPVQDTVDAPTSDAASPTAEPSTMKPTSDTAWTATTALSGLARDAKGGAVLLVGTAAVPVYLDGLDAWPEARHGTLQHVHGQIVRERHLPEAAQDEDGAWSQGVAPGSAPEWVLRHPTIVERPLEAPAVPADLARAAWPEHAACLDAIAAALAPSGLGDFLVGTGVEQREDELVFPLWHRTAFLPENAGMTGNPGGQSRNALCDASSGRFDRFLFWQ